MPRSHAPRSGRSLALAVALALALAVPAAAGAQDGRLELAKFLDFESVLPHFLGGGMGPQVKPDGSEILYARTRVDKMKDRWASELWLMNADGSKNRRLMEGGNAVWSPDGTRIAYVAQGELKGAQIFVRWMDDEGATSQVTRLEHGPGGVSWSPDGEWIAFTMLVPSDPELSISLPKPPGAEWTADAKVVTRAQYRRDYVGYTDAGYTHIFVVPAEGGTPRQLTSGDWNHSGIEWTPDGREILFSSLREPDAERQFRESAIYAVDVASSRIRQITDRAGTEYGAAVSPDGRLVAYTGHETTDDAYFANDLHVVGIDGSNPRTLAVGLDRSPGNLIWARDGSGIYFNADDRGTSNLWFADLQGGYRQVTEGDHTLSIHSIAHDGLAVGTRVTVDNPGDVVAFDVRRPTAMRQLTRVNDDVLADVALGEIEEIWYKSYDGLDIQGWIVKPPDFDPRRKYPLALAIHGGPHGMYSLATPYMWFEWQNYAAQGYVVLYTNPRGSSGYGSEFGNAIENDYPNKDFHDLMAGVDTVINRGYVDTDNLFVYGCSGGGVLTAWTVGHTDRFTAASSECPVINWMSFVGTTDGLGWYRNFEKWPWEDPTEHLRRSPLMYVGNVTTPTILITGEKDLRTPIGQTEEFYQALQLLGVPTAMVRLQDEYHAYFGKPSNFMRMLEYRRAWFEKWKKPGRATTE